MKNLKKTRRILLVVFWLSNIIFASDIYSQVTIGSGEPPRKTSLLQLKDQEPDAKNVTSKSGGFLLPRVELQDENTLEPFLATTDPDYSEQAKGSVGLMVYNVADITGLSPGIYYWDGEKWASLTDIGGDGRSGEISDPDPDITDIDDPEALKLPNSYIIPSNTTLYISPMKGYATWKQILHFEQNELDGQLSVELLWQTKKDLIKSVSLVDGDKGMDSEIRIETTENDIDGNAVIAARLNGDILWSWHIWVTDYDPEIADNQKQNGDIIFMDRNLGALTLEPNSIITNGMLYQWGRKDPFPGSRNLTSGIERTLFDIDNNEVFIKKSEVAEWDNLPNAVKNPDTFYTNTNGDWISNGNGNDRSDVTLWNRGNNLKGVYDPCPCGWRVPNREAWNNLPVDNSYLASYGVDWNIGELNAGFYPYAGNRDDASGDPTVTESSEFGKLWTAQSNTYDKKAPRLAFYRHYISLPNTYSPRAEGNSVRCIKE